MSSVQRPRTAPASQSRRRQKLAPLDTFGRDESLQGEQPTASNVWINRVLLRPHTCMTHKARKSQEYSRHLASQIEVARDARTQYIYQSKKLQDKQGLLVELNSTIAPKALKKRLAQERARATRLTRQTRDRGRRTSNQKMDDILARVPPHRLNMESSEILFTEKYSRYQFREEVIHGAQLTTNLGARDNKRASTMKERRRLVYSSQVAKARNNTALLDDHSAQRNLLRKCQDIVRCQRNAMFLLQSDGMLVFQVAPDAPEVRIPADKGIAGQVLCTGKTSNVPNAYFNASFNPAVDRQTGFATFSMLCAPIIHPKRRTIIGVCQMINKLVIEDDTLNSFSSETKSAKHKNSSFKLSSAPRSSIVNLREPANLPAGHNQDTSTAAQRGDPSMSRQAPGVLRNGELVKAFSKADELILEKCCLQIAKAVVDKDGEGGIIKGIAPGAATSGLVVLDRLRVDHNNPEITIARARDAGAAQAGRLRLQSVRATDIKNNYKSESKKKSHDLFSVSGDNDELETQSETKWRALHEQMDTWSLKLAELVNAESCEFLYCDKQTDELHFCDRTLDTYVRFPISCGIAGRTARHHSAQIVNEVSSDKDYNRSADNHGAGGLQSVLYVPVISPSNEECVAVVRASNKTAHTIESDFSGSGFNFNSTDMENLKMFCNSEPLFVEFVAALEKEEELSDNHHVPSLETDMEAQKQADEAVVLISKICKRISKQVKYRDSELAVVSQQLKQSRGSLWKKSLVKNAIRLNRNHGIVDLVDELNAKQSAAA